VVTFLTVVCLLVVAAVALQTAAGAQAPKTNQAPTVEAQDARLTAWS
jgi:hypothetical protein